MNYEKKEWKKRYCRECLRGVINPREFYLCWQERKIGFNCKGCLKFIEEKACAGFYETGSCFCKVCQDLIRKWLERKEYACEYPLKGYSERHSIHGYREAINGLVEVFFLREGYWKV